MNKVSALICAFVVMLTGCLNIPPKAALLQADREKTFVIDTNLSKSEVKEKTLAFLGEYFVSSKSVIQSSEGDMIVGNYRFEIGKWDNYPMNCDLTFIVKCSDNSAKCKLIFKQMKIEMLGREYDADEYYGSYRNSLALEYADFERKYKEYLSKPLF